MFRGDIPGWYANPVTPGHFMEPWSKLLTTSGNPSRETTGASSNRIWKLPCTEMALIGASTKTLRPVPCLVEQLLQHGDSRPVVRARRTARQEPSRGSAGRVPGSSQAHDCQAQNSRKLQPRLIGRAERTGLIFNGYHQ